MSRIKIEKLVPGGFGLGALEDGKKAFLFGVLPGEVATEVVLTKKKAKYVEGFATEVEEKSEFRVLEKDEFYIANSPWQIFRYDFELKEKGKLVQESFKQEGIEIEAPEVETDGEEYFYRNKMEYALYWDKETEKIELGIHQRGSHRKMPIFQSHLERPEIFEAAKKIVLELNQRHEEARNYQSLVLRTSQAGNVSGGLLRNGESHPKFENLTDSILGVSYSYSPNGFFQINLPVYELALEQIKEEITTEKVLDLYSGVGTIGLSVAAGRDLTLVELNKAAFSELKKNAKGRGRAVLAKSEEALEYIEPEETVILDPPRAGCEKKLIEKLLEVGPEKIIYLSCNPATQARDVKALLERYSLKKVRAFNFFPKTPHIENLVILERKA